MRLIDQVTGLLGPKIATVCGAAAGSAGTALAMLGDFALQVLGVPLPVVLASAAGAGLARSFADPVGFWRALALTTVWTIIGCAGAPLAQAIGPALVQLALNREVTLPANTLAALGAIVGSAPWWWPKAWPVAAAWLEGRFGNARGKKDGDGDGKI